MNEKIFNHTLDYFNTHIISRHFLHFVYKVLPLVMFIIYPVLLVYAYFYLRLALPKLILVPLGVFLGVTVLRLLVNEQRPYEKYGRPSVFGKETKGKSFPSRHTASAFIIAMAFLYVNVPAGITMLFIALLIEFSRILAGAHYIHDVAAGMLIGTVCGYLFFFLL